MGSNESAAMNFDSNEGFWWWGGGRDLERYFETREAF